MSPAETIGDRIRQVRGALTQAEFSSRLAIHAQTLGKYERNERLPDADFIIRLCGMFNRSADWLLTGDDGIPEVGIGGRRAPLVMTQNFIVDEDLMGLIGEGISKAYEKANSRIGPPGNLTRLAARVYSDLLEFPDEERTIALRVILSQMLKDLLQPNDNQGKRLA